MLKMFTISCGMKALSIRNVDNRVCYESILCRNAYNLLWYESVMCRKYSISKARSILLPRHRNLFNLGTMCLPMKNKGPCKRTQHC